MVPPLWHHLDRALGQQEQARGLLVSETGVELARPVAFKFALDLTLSSPKDCSCAPVPAVSPITTTLARKDSLSARAAQRQAGTPPRTDEPGAVVVSVSFINEFNAWKTGQLDCSPLAEDGTKAGERGAGRRLPVCVGGRATALKN